jgi:pyruvate,water dikinase
MGTSKGRYTGRARIIASQKEIGKVQKGEILICPATDPGWTPVFMVISGLVLETGGMLAHGSLISREYGIPAVQIVNAMKRIPDGALITVDGNSGKVTIEDEPETALAAE